MAVSEKSHDMTKETEHLDDVDVVERVHVDGTVDLIDTNAIGGDLDQMPKGYYYSPQFIGTVVVSSKQNIQRDIADLKGDLHC